MDVGHNTWYNICRMSGENEFEKYVDDGDAAATENVVNSCNEFIEERVKFWYGTHTDLSNTFCT